MHLDRLCQSERNVNGDCYRGRRRLLYQNSGRAELKRRPAKKREPNKSAPPVGRDENKEVWPRPRFNVYLCDHSSNIYAMNALLNSRIRIDYL